MRQLNSLSKSFFLTIGFTLLASCQLYDQPRPPRDRVHFPISIAVHPSGRYLYVVNSNFDTRYLEDYGGTVSVIDAESGQTLPKETPYIPSFGGLISLNSTGTMAYIPTRYDSTVTAFNISPDGSRLYCSRDSSDPSSPDKCKLGGIARNVEGGKARVGRSPYSAAVDTTFRSATISGLGANATVSLNTAQLPTQTFTGDATQIAAEISKLDGLTASVEGSGVKVKTASPSVAVRFFPSQNQTVTVDADDTIFVDSLQSNKISSFFLPQQSFDHLSMVNTPINASSGGIAKRPGSKDVVVVERTGSSLVVLQPQFSADKKRLNTLFKVGELPLSNRATQLYGKGVAFSPDGHKGYVISQSPSALYMIRIVKVPTSSPYEQGTSRDVYLIEKTIPLKSGPNSVIYHDTLNGPKVYVTSAGAKSITVLDANVGAVVDEILLGDTPSDFAINEAYCKNDIEKCVGYVALYDDTPNGNDTCSTAAAGQCGAVGVIDLNPLSPQYHQLVRKFE